MLSSVLYTPQVDLSPFRIRRRSDMRSRFPTKQADTTYLINAYIITHKIYINPKRGLPYAELLVTVELVGLIVG